jgi:hypothetical protein
MPEPKKKVKRKRKTRAKPGQVITQKVTVNIGKSGYGTKRRTGTQAKRSVQPQVIYQQQPIPLQPDYSSQLNDLRNEVRTHLSGVDKEDGRRRAIELREQHDAQMVQDELARRIAVQEGIQGTAPQTERADAPAVAPADSFVTSLEPRKPPPDNPLEPPKRGRSSTERQAPAEEGAAADPGKEVISITKKKKAGRKPGSKNKPKEAVAKKVDAPIQEAKLAGVVGVPVSQLEADEKERLAEEAGIRSAAGGAAAAEGQTSMTDYVFR